MFPRFFVATAGFTTDCVVVRHDGPRACEAWAVTATGDRRSNFRGWNLVTTLSAVAEGVAQEIGSAEAEELVRSAARQSHFPSKPIPSSRGAGVPREQIRC